MAIAKGERVSRRANRIVVRSGGWIDPGGGLEWEREQVQVWKSEAREALSFCPAIQNWPAQKRQQRPPKVSVQRTLVAGSCNRALQPRPVDLWVTSQCVAGLELDPSCSRQLTRAGHSPIQFIQRFNRETPLSRSPNCLRRHMGYNLDPRGKPPFLLCPGPQRINQLASADAGAKMGMRRLATIGVCCWALVTGDQNDGNGNRNGNVEPQCHLMETPSL